MSLVNPDIKGNPFYDLMMAIANSSQSITEQQQADATSAVNYGKLEQAVNAYWYGPSDGNPAVPPGAGAQNLQYWINGITYYAAGAGKGDSNANNYITDFQTNFNKASAMAQSAASSADSLMQSSNSQASNDATNIQSTNQLAQMLNIVGFIANLLAKG
jgi:hypothetical protein